MGGEHQSRLVPEDCFTFKKAPTVLSLRLLRPSSMTQNIEKLEFAPVEIELDHVVTSGRELSRQA